MAENRRIIPSFATEAEEAHWCFENQDRMAEEFKEAATNGTLTCGTVARRGNTPTTTTRLDPAGISQARTLVRERGLKYESYLKSLIHEALEREASVAN
jgi:hypothetical protein